MRFQKTKKILIIIGLGLLVIQIPWYILVQSDANKTQTKTTATVIRIGHANAGCSGDSINIPDTTCDHSDRLYPIYAYYDESGKRHEQDDRFLGEYKQNNPLEKVFGKNVGDKVVAYYTKDKPDDVVFMASIYAYTAWLIPLFVAVPLFIISGIIYAANRFGWRLR